MCVTAGRASIKDTRTYVHALSDQHGPVHVCGYQNQAENQESGPNVMFLNFAGSNLEMVRGPEHTHHLMADMTVGLEELEYVPRFRGGSFGGSKGISVVDYGDYTVILAQGPTDILSALHMVRPEHRPADTPQLRERTGFYMSQHPTHSFLLGCFDGKVKPKHPLVVRYRPHRPQVLTIPGLDAHDGRNPAPGAPVYRNFRVAFGVRGIDLPHQVRYSDPGVASQYWAPMSVAGFVDNRHDGANRDYVIPVEALRAGRSGKELADALL